PRRRLDRCTTRRASGSGSPTTWKKPTPRGAETSPPRRGASRARRLAATGILAAAMALALPGCRRGPVPAAGSPQRVVTLAPNLTEIVFALHAESRLVGVSEYSDYPEAARSIPRVGGLEVSAERVASFRPDLVLASRDGNAKGPVLAIEAAGIPVL